MRLVDADVLYERFKEEMKKLVKSTIHENVDLEALSLLCGAKLITDARTVNAVPVEPLCKWLSDNYEPPYPSSCLKELTMPPNHKQQFEIWMQTMGKLMKGEI